MNAKAKVNPAWIRLSNDPKPFSPKIEERRKVGVNLTWGTASNPQIRTYESRVQLLSALLRLRGNAYRKLMKMGWWGIPTWQAHYRLQDDWVREMAEATVNAGLQERDVPDTSTVHAGFQESEFPWTLPLWSLEEPGRNSPERFAVPQPSLLKVRVQSTWYPDEESRAMVRDRMLAKCAAALDAQLSAIECRSGALVTPPRIHSKEIAHFEWFVRCQCLSMPQGKVAKLAKVDRTTIRDGVASVARLTGTKNLTIGTDDAS